jgi:heme exporter protein A
MFSSSIQQLRIDNIAFERNDRYLFSEINCILQAGELLQIRGDNGSGKSTLLRIIAGLIEPQVGRVLGDEKSIDPQQLHYIGHQNGVKLHLTVRENLQLFSALTTQPIDSDNLKRIMQRMGLSSLQHKHALQLSAGQLRRLALARLLLHPVALWVLDEPATALDDAGQALLADLLTQHLTAGGIAILALHQSLPLQCATKTIRLGEQHA